MCPFHLKMNNSCLKSSSKIIYDLICVQVTSYWFMRMIHRVKSVQIRIYFWSVFSCIQSEYRKLRIRNNSAVLWWKKIYWTVAYKNLFYRVQSVWWKMLSHWWWNFHRDYKMQHCLVLRGSQAHAFNRSIKICRISLT